MDGPGEYYAFSKISQSKTNIIYCHVYVESKNKKANIMKQIHKREERRKGQNKIGELRGKNFETLCCTPETSIINQLYFNNNKNYSRLHSY